MAEVSWNDARDHAAWLAHATGCEHAQRAADDTRELTAGADADLVGQDFGEQDLGSGGRQWGRFDV